MLVFRAKSKLCYSRLGQVKERRLGRSFLPSLRLLSLVCLAVFKLPGYGAQFAPGLQTGLIDLVLFFLGKLFVGHVFFILILPNLVSEISIA